MESTENNRLSEKNYWNSIYNVIPSSNDSKPGLKKRLGRIIGEKYRMILNDYSEYIFWNGVLPKYLKSNPSKKFLEVGSAPGHYLLNFHKHLSYDVYGIEYSESGSLINKKNFALAGLNEDHIIQGDLFEPGIQSKYENYFDIVYSGGLIEHFSNVEEVIEKHVHLLKPGGTLLITIPNLRHANYRMAKFFDKEILDIHNLTIMDIDRFKSKFENMGLAAVFSGYYGTFNFELFTASNAPRKFLLKLIKLLFKYPLNLVLYFLFGLRGKDSKYFSPYLIYIGQKV